MGTPSRWRVLSLVPSHDRRQVLVVEQQFSGRVGSSEAGAAEGYVATLAGPSATPIRRAGLFGGSDIRLSTAGRWSPDDSSIAVAAADPRSSARRAIGLVDAASGRWHKLPPPPGVEVLLSDFPSWSSDGNFVAFDALVKGERYAVCLYDHQSERSRLLTPGTSYRVTNPLARRGWIVLSREAETITAPSGSRMQRHRFYQADLKTGDERELLAEHVVERISLAPNGDAAVALCLPEDGRHDGYELWYTALDGESPPRRLTQATSEPPTLVWSANARYLVAAAHESGPSASAPGTTPPLVLVEVATGKVRPLRDGRGRAIRGGQPHWTDADRTILYLLSGQTGRELWRYDVQSRRTSRLFPPAKPSSRARILSQ